MICEISENHEDFVQDKSSLFPEIRFPMNMKYTAYKQSTQEKFIKK